jgi:hypothetical protein
VEPTGAERGRLQVVWEAIGVVGEGVSVAPYRRLTRRPLGGTIEHHLSRFLQAGVVQLVDEIGGHCLVGEFEDKYLDVLQNIEFGRLPSAERFGRL